MGESRSERLEDRSQKDAGKGVMVRRFPMHLCRLLFVDRHLAGAVTNVAFPSIAFATSLAKRTSLAADNCLAHLRPPNFFSPSSGKAVVGYFESVFLCLLSR